MLPAFKRFLVLRFGAAGLALLLVGVAPFYGQVRPASPYPSSQTMEDFLAEENLEDAIDKHWDWIESETAGGMLAISRLTEPKGLSRFISNLLDFYAASRDLMAYRFAPNSADWAREGAAASAEQMEQQLDDVASYVADLEAVPVALPSALTDFPLRRQLSIMGSLIERVSPKLNQVAQVSDIVDIPLLRLIDSELRAIRIVSAAIQQ